MIISTGCAQTVRPLGDKELFVKGDNWCVIGDSITHGGAYHKYIYLYYATRFPNARFDLFNCGVGGDTATGTLSRMNTDILAHKPTIAIIMLGMNDVWWLNNDHITLADYTRDLTAMVDQLAKDNCRVMLFTPSIYDETAKTGTDIDPKHAGLNLFAQQVRRIAAQKKLPCIDAFGCMMEITAKMQAADPAFTLIHPDRAHPKDEGHFIMAYQFLKDMNQPALVSKLVLNAKTAQAAVQQNCRAGNVIFGDNISFSLLENSLPFPVSEIPAGAVSLVPFTSDLNQEILQINGLESGDYELLIDQKLMGVYSADEFEQGLNLALVAATPQNIQAQAVAQLNSSRHSIEANKLRYIAMMEYGVLKNLHPADDVDNALKDVDAYMAKITDPAAIEAENQRWKPYREYKPIQAQLIKEAAELNEKMWAANKPAAHSFLIKRVK